MKKLNNKIKIASLALVVSMFVLSSCNKNLETFAPIVSAPYSANAGNIGATIAANPSDTMFYRLIVRSGLLPLLSDSTRKFTVFAVDNAGMKIFVNAASGGAVLLTAPDATFYGFINSSLPVASAAGIIQYLTIGQLYPSSAIPTQFPNYPLPSQIQLDPANPFVRMTLTIAKGVPNSYVNNIPLTGVDQLASNGVIHHTFTIPAPPSATIRTLINAEPNLTYFRTALLRADSGQVVKANNDSTNFLNYFMGYGILNMTVLPPSDAAFQTFIYTVVFGRTLQALGVTPATATPAQLAIANTQATGAVAAGPAFLNTNNVTTEQVRGIIAYHILASNSTGSFAPNIRVFNVNVPASPAGVFVRTLVNGSAAGALHPGIRATATFTGPVATGLTFTGFAALVPGAPFTDVPANAIKRDNNGVNGIYHIIDRVLIPLPL